MRKLVFTFLIGGVLGVAGGFALGIFVYPYIFLADIVATEKVEEAETKQVVATGSFAHADPLYMRSLVIAEETLGPDHPRVAQTLENYAALLRETGRGAAATNMEARAKAIRAKRAKQSPAK